jgi:hypothetical protein
VPDLNEVSLVALSLCYLWLLLSSGFELVLRVSLLARVCLGEKEGEGIKERRRGRRGKMGSGGCNRAGSFGRWLGMIQTAWPIGFFSFHTTATLTSSDL